MTVYNVIGDAYIVKQSPTQNTGSETLLKLRKEPANDQYFDTLMDFATMPHDKVVTWAKLHIYQHNSEQNLYTGYRCTQDWAEGSVTWTSRPTYETSSGNSVTILFSYAPGWIEKYITQIVKRWVEDEDPQYGIIIDAITATWNNATTEMRSKEHSGGAYKAYIEVMFEEVVGKAVIFGQVG